MPTTPPPFSLPVFDQDCAIRARIWSPSIDVAVFIRHHDPVGVAVQRDAEIGAALAHLALHRFRLGRTAIVVDVEAVGLNAHRDISAPSSQSTAGATL